MKADAGVQLMKDYMEILDDDDAWELTAKCFSCKSECNTPWGNFLSSEEPSSSGNSREHRQLRWSVGGSVCVDVSMMGNRMALLGESSKSLAIFLAHVKKTKPQVVTHECTSYFSQFLFDMFLEDLYTIHRIQAPADGHQHSATRAGFQSGTWLISPHQMGWPAFRPRWGFGCLLF